MTEFRQTRQGYVDALIELATEIPELLVLDADVAKATKTADFQKKFPSRHINCGTAEQNELSVAAGLALEGFLPFATTFAMFATARAGDQLRNSIAYPKLNVKVAATHGGITTGGDGASHQACEDIAIARALPNMTVLVPGDYEEARRATLAAARHVGPVYLRFGRDTYPVVPALHGEFVIGRAKLLRNGGDVTLVSTGIMAGEALRAAEQLAAAGISARVLHYPTIKPFDAEPLLRAARQTRGLVTAEEHSIIGGLGEAAAAAILEAGLGTPLRRIGVRDVFGESGQAGDLLDKFGLRAANIAQAAQALLRPAAVPA
ncbi:MAG: transketolase family protein [Verrucomicrobia bacterium]|nr:transketolase family protein [Verrucomicrobiota bacterium]